MTKALSTEVSKGSAAPVFKPSGYGSEEAVALRGFYQSAKQQSLNRFLNWMGVSTLNTFAVVAPASVLTVGACFSLVVGSLGGDPILASMGALTLGAGLGVPGYFSFGEKTAKKRAAEAASQSLEELNGWMEATYGFNIAATFENGLNLLVGSAENPHIYLKLRTADGLYADGKLVEVSPGSFELQRYSDDPASRYFEPLPSANQLTANRVPALSITASRSTE